MCHSTHSVCLYRICMRSLNTIAYRPLASATRNVECINYWIGKLLPIELKVLSFSVCARSTHFQTANVAIKYQNEKVFRFVYTMQTVPNVRYLRFRSCCLSLFAAHRSPARRQIHAALINERNMFVRLRLSTAGHLQMPPFTRLLMHVMHTLEQHGYSYSIWPFSKMK